jgi:hypothetical protein
MLRAFAIRFGDFTHQRKRHQKTVRESTDAAGENFSNRTYAETGFLNQQSRLSTLVPEPETRFLS